VFAFHRWTPQTLLKALLRVWSVGFLVFYLGQRLLLLQACPSGDCDANRHVGRMSALGLIAHSTVDGASIAAATLISWRIGLVVAVGIIVHDITDGVNTVLLVTRGAPAGKKDFAFLLADAVAPNGGRCACPCLRLAFSSTRAVSRSNVWIFSFYGNWRSTPRRPPPFPWIGSVYGDSRWNRPDWDRGSPCINLISVLPEQLQRCSTGFMGF
jgi:hypothetical protein